MRSIGALRVGDKIIDLITGEKYMVWRNTHDCIQVQNVWRDTHDCIQVQNKHGKVMMITREMLDNNFQNEIVFEFNKELRKVLEGR